MIRRITAIIADDEPPARQYLRLLLPESLLMKSERSPRLAAASA